MIHFELIFVKGVLSMSKFIFLCVDALFFQRRLWKKLEITSESESHSDVSDSLQPHGLYCPWNSPGQNTGVGSHFLLQYFREYVYQ